MPSTYRRARWRRCVLGSRWNWTSVGAVLVGAERLLAAIPHGIEDLLPNKRPRLCLPQIAIESCGNSTLRSLSIARGQHASQRRFDNAGHDPSLALCV